MKKQIRVFLGFTLMMGLVTGCSEVKFSSEPVGSLENPGDPVRPPIDPPIDPPDDPPIRESVKDTFYQQVEKTQVDVLVVIDNSRSMVEEQAKIGQRISSFLGHLNDVDWQLGMTSTDISGGKFSTNGELMTFNSTNLRILNKNVPDHNKIFMNSVRRPESDCWSECASGDEQPLQASIMAIDKRDGANHGFFRDNTDLVMVVISDEDELSTGPIGATKPGDVIQKFKSVWGTSKSLTVYGILILPGDQNCFDVNAENGGNYGTYVYEFAKATGGISGSICDNDYGASLSSIGQRVRNLLNSFTLTADVDPATVKVTLTPTQAIGWRVEGRKIIFDRPPSSGTKVEVDYLKPAK